MVLHMRNHKVIDISLDRSGRNRMNMVTLKDRIGFHNCLCRKIRNLKRRVRNVYIRHHSCQAAERLDKKGSFFAGCFQLDLILAILQILRALQSFL